MDNIIMGIMIINIILNILYFVVILYKLKVLRETEYSMERIRQNTENAVNNINKRVCNEPYSKAIDDCTDYLKSICKYRKKEIEEISNEELIADCIKTYKSYKENYTMTKIF